MKQSNIITVFGANGFIGAGIVRLLARQGYTLKLPHKHPRACDFLKVNGRPEIVPVTCDFFNAGLNDVITDHRLLSIVLVYWRKRVSARLWGRTAICRKI